jgi:hypothetical protein
MHTYTSEHVGRLGNQIIRNLAVSLIAEKYDLKVEYSSENLITNLGINLFSGKQNFDNTIVLNDDNYFSIYNCEKLDSNLDPNNNYFQTKDITNFLYNYLHTDKIKSNIINKNPFIDRYNNNNDLFIHVRLTDAINVNPGVHYYLNSIKGITFDNLYISSDEPEHPIMKEIIENYPNSKLIYCNEINTMQFGSTCKNIILSGGSFSAVIGYLAFFSNVHYPEYYTIWHGDMFTISKWIKHNYPYDE